MAENTVKLSFRGMPGVEIEGIAAADIMTGMLLTKDNTGKYLPHNLAFEYNMPWVAVEDPYQGGYDKDLDQAAYYAAGKKVYLVVPQRGDVMWMWATAGLNYEVSELLLSNGDGMLNASGGGTHTDGAVVGIVLEGVNATTGVKRIKVEIA